MIKFVSIYLMFFSLSVIASPPTIDEFTEGMEAKQGFYSFFYQVDDGKLYLQINDFDQAFLFQSSLPQGVGSNDIGLDR